MYILLNLYVSSPYFSQLNQPILSLFRICTRHKQNNQKKLTQKVRGEVNYTFLGVQPKSRSVPPTLGRPIVHLLRPPYLYQGNLNPELPLIPPLRLNACLPASAVLSARTKRPAFVLVATNCAASDLLLPLYYYIPRLNPRCISLFQHLPLSLTHDSNVDLRRCCSLKDRPHSPRALCQLLLDTHCASPA